MTRCPREYTIPVVRPQMHWQKCDSYPVYVQFYVHTYVPGQGLTLVSAPSSVQEREDIWKWALRI